MLTDSGESVPGIESGDFWVAAGSGDVLSDSCISCYILSYPSRFFRFDSFFVLAVFGSFFSAPSVCRLDSDTFWAEWYYCFFILPTFKLPD